MNMNTLTPFSGLSLIIHLLIIGIAIIIKTVIKKSGMVFRIPTRVASLWARYRIIVLPSVSISIIIIIGFGISASTIIALKTGLREGALESHSEFIHKRYVYLQEARENFAGWNKSLSVVQKEERVFEPIETTSSYTPMLAQFSFTHLMASEEGFYPLPLP